MRLVIDCRLRFGVGTVLRNLVPRLASRVDELTLLGSEGLLEAWRIEARNVRLVPFDSRVYGPGEQLHFPYRIQRSCDLLHVPSYNVPLRWRGPMAVTINDLAHLSGAMPTNPVQKAYARFFIRKAIARSRELLTLSEFSRRAIASTFQVPAERITVAYCGVDPKVFHRPPAGSSSRVAALLGFEAPYILMAGSLRPHKNANSLLLAFQELKRRYGIPHQLVVVGEHRGFRVNAARVTLPADVEQAVRFTGFVTDETLRLLYGCCSVFVYPSLYEGFGLPPLEAMACGAPVVASNRSSLPEVVGDAGVLVDPLDIPVLAGAIHRVVSDDALREGLRAQGLARAKGFTWERTAETYMQVFHRCVSS